MTEGTSAITSPERYEFRFRWDKREHRRFYRVLQQEAKRGSTARRVLNVWFGFIALLGLRALWPDVDGADIVGGLVPLTIVTGWLMLDRWGLAYISAARYEREHALCIPNDQIRVLDAAGVTAECTTSRSSVNWAGISKVLETNEFFLFVTAPGCAIQLPKRAIGDLDRFSAWLSAVPRTV
jgi:hypothetical protein